MHAKQQENGDLPEWVIVKLDAIAAYQYCENKSYRSHHCYSSDGCEGDVDNR